MSLLIVFGVGDCVASVGDRTVSLWLQTRCWRRSLTERTPELPKKNKLFNIKINFHPFRNQLSPHLTSKLCLACFACFLQLIIWFASKMNWWRGRGRGSFQNWVCIFERVKNLEKCMGTQRFRPSYWYWYIVSVVSVWFGNMLEAEVPENKQEISKGLRNHPVVRKV